MDDRVFLRILVAKIADDGLHVGAVEQFDNFIDAELVEVDARAACLALPPSHAQKGLHQLAQEGVRPHVAHEVVWRPLLRIGDAG